MTEPTITWHDAPGALAADPAASVGLSRAGWEAAGASFTDVDDGQGETPALATASLARGDDVIDFGVLDYGEETTYLLIGTAADDARATKVVGVLSALADAGVLRPDVVLELARRHEATLEERVVALERRVAALSPGSSGDPSVDPVGFGGTKLGAHAMYEAVERAFTAEAGQLSWAERLSQPGTRSAYEALLDDLLESRVQKESAGSSKPDDD